MCLRINKKLVGISALLMCLLPSMAIAQGYFRIINPLEKTQVPTSSTLLVPSVGAEIDSTKIGRYENLPKVEGLYPGANQKLLNFEVGMDGKLLVAAPKPQLISGDKPAIVHPVFLRGTTQAIVAWNGKTDADGEELVIFSSDWISEQGQNEAVLGIFPLPGKPISIERVDDTIFKLVKTLTDKKLAEVSPPSGRAVSGSLVMPNSASYSIFVLHFEDIDHFAADVNYFTKNVFGFDVQVIMTVREKEIVKHYWKRGFRYFAFDVSHLGKILLHQTAVAYRFQSTFAYYPLAISAIGGTGHGLIDLVVMTPGAINLRGAFEHGKEEAPIIVKGKTSVDFTMDEVSGLDPQLSNVFKADGLRSVRVRNFLIEADDIGKFKNDFIASPAEQHAPAQDESDTPDEEEEMDAPSDVHLIFANHIQGKSDNVARKDSEGPPVTKSEIDESMLFSVVVESSSENEKNDAPQSETLQPSTWDELRAEKRTLNVLVMHTELSAENVVELASINSLKSVAFYGVTLPREGLVALQKAAGLESLTIASTAINDKICEQILEMKTLHTLDLYYHIDLSDKNIEKILSNANIKEITLFDCTSITDQALLQLSKKHPQCLICVRGLGVESPYNLLKGEKELQ